MILPALFTASFLAAPPTAAPVETAVGFLAAVQDQPDTARRDRRGRASDRERGAGRDLEVVEHPQAVGDSGIAWYTTWESGLQEAQRSNRPIFFMAAATCTSGVSGTF